MSASNVGLMMMADEAAMREIPLTRNFIRTLHRALLREDYTVYLNLPDGCRQVRTPNHTKILNAMQTQPTLLADMREITGISIAAIQKFLDQLIQKKYVERGEKDGSWRVFVTQ